MDRNTPHSLTPDEAKAQLRTAAQQVSLTSLMSHRAWRILAVALAGGFVVGRLRIPLTTALLMQRIAPALLTVLLWRKNKKTNP